MSSLADQKQHSEYQVNLETLMEIPFFAGLPLEALKLIAYLCTRETFDSGEYLFRQDEIDGNAYYILEGKASLIMDKNLGQVLNVVQAEDFIGGLSLLGDMKRLFSLRSEEKTVCIVLTREKFQKTIDQFPYIVNKILENIVDRVYHWESKFLREHGETCHECRTGAGVSLL